MKKYVLNYLLGAVIVAFLAQCKDSVPQGEKARSLGADATKITDFPPVKNIDTVKTTNFVAEVGSGAPVANNIVYSPTFLFAWDELRTMLGGSLKLVDPVPDLTNVNEATSFRGSLSKQEYVTEAKLDGEGGINMSASFRKTLPFVDEMDTSVAPFNFLETPVKAFGMPYYSEKIAQNIHILYYENNDRFIIKVSPKDADQEIVLAKGFNGKLELNSILKSVNESIEKGRKQWEGKKTDKKRYTLEEDDKVIIPVLRFNLEKNFRDFIGKSILKPDSEKYVIVKATQRTAFVLDEFGTKAESVAELGAAPAPAAEPEHPNIAPKKPKLLVFDKPFLVMLRKNGISHPYLMVKIMNAELMVKR